LRKWNTDFLKNEILSHLNEGELMKRIILLSSMLILTSCGDDKAATTGAVKTSFNDSTITDFQQISNVARSRNEFLPNLFISSAYAAAGYPISCTQGSDVEFKLTGLQNAQVDVTTKCSTAASIDLGIRAKLLETLVNKKMIREISEQGKDTTAFSMPATAAAMSLGVSVKNNKSSVTDCYDLYKFNLNTGEIIISNDGIAGDPGNNLNCISPPQDDDYTAGFVAHVKYRFKDGKLELNVDNELTFDSGAVNGSGVPANISYERWCIDDNQDGSCDI